MFQGLPPYPCFSLLPPQVQSHSWKMQTRLPLCCLRTSAGCCCCRTLTILTPHHTLHGCWCPVPAGLRLPNGLQPALPLPQSAF